MLDFILLYYLVINVSAKLQLFFKICLPFLSFGYEKTWKARKRVNNKVVKVIQLGRMNKKK